MNLINQHIKTESEASKMEESMKSNEAGEATQESVQQILKREKSGSANK